MKGEAFWRKHTWCHRFRCRRGCSPSSNGLQLKLRKTQQIHLYEHMHICCCRAGRFRLGVSTLSSKHFRVYARGFSSCMNKENDLGSDQMKRIKMYCILQCRSFGEHVLGLRVKLRWEFYPPWQPNMRLRELAKMNCASCMFTESCKYKRLSYVMFVCLLV